MANVWTRIPNVLISDTSFLSFLHDLFTHKYFVRRFCTIFNMPTVTYEPALMFWRMITQIFFREIRPRGAFNIPRDGPVIFVGAPHHNQVCL